MSPRDVAYLVGAMVLLIGALVVITGGTVGRDIKVASTSVWQAFQQDARGAFDLTPTQPQRQRELARVIPAENKKQESTAKQEPKKGAKKSPRAPQADKVAKKEDQTPHRRVTYRASGDGWTVVSGYEGENIFWEKTRTVNGKPKTVRFLYPPSERARYDRIIANVDLQF